MLARVACAPDQRFDLRAGLGLENLVEFLGPAGEALFVFLFAAQAGDGQIKGFGVRPMPRTRSRPTSTTARRYFVRRGSSNHTPLPAQQPFRRPQHQQHRKTIGMSHRSRVSRTVMPASE